MATQSVLTPPPVVSVKKDPKLANNWKTKSAEELSDDEVLAMPDSEYMNEKQMAFFRAKLLQLKTDILNSAGETTEHLREDTVIVPDPADRATIEEEHALELRTRDRERKLAIMRDSRIGAFGASALFLSLSLRIGALAALASRIDGGAVVAAILMVPANIFSAFLVQATFDCRPARPISPPLISRLVELPAAVTVAVSHTGVGVEVSQTRYSNVSSPEKPAAGVGEQRQDLQQVLRRAHLPAEGREQVRRAELHVVQHLGHRVAVHEVGDLVAAVLLIAAQQQHDHDEHQRHHDVAHRAGSRSAHDDRRCHGDGCSTGVGAPAPPPVPAAEPDARTRPAAAGRGASSAARTRPPRAGPPRPGAAARPARRRPARPVSRRPPPARGAPAIRPPPASRSAHRK